MDQPPAFDLGAYLDRIGYAGSRAPTLETLAEIQRRHVFAIPFENLDLHLGRSIRIDLPSVARKLVADRRGGYCFEQNALLRAALAALGYRVTALLARVRWQVPVDVPTAATHMVLAVELGGRRWLVDGGFGSGSLTAPLDLDLAAPQPTPHEPRRIVRRGRLLVQQTSQTGEWADLYQFPDEPVPDVDFEVGNWYTSTHPQSRFVQNLVAARADHGLRYTLLNAEFAIRRTDLSVDKRTMGSPEELLAVLEEYFHLRFPPGTRFGRPGSAWPS